MDLELAGRIAVVTGASAGIGRGIARVLADEGAALVIIARREELLQSLAEELSGRSPKVTSLRADLGQYGDVLRAAHAVQAERGRVDILVNNVGGSLPLPLGAPQNQWDEAIALQFTAARVLAEQFIPAMREAQWGRIINIGGTLEPPDQVNGSTVAKAAMVAWAKSLSRSVGRDGITVNTIVPGRIMSEQVQRRLHPTEEERVAFAAANIPVGYIGEPEDVGRVVAFLASPLARYITGEVIHVDGGMHRFGF